MTGISDDATTLSTKRLSLLKQLLPRLQRVAMLWNQDDLGMSLRYEASAKAAQAIGVTVQPLGVREPNDFDGAFAAMDREPPDAILMVSDALTSLNRKRVFETQQICERSEGPRRVWRPLTARPAHTQVYRHLSTNIGM